MGLLDCLIFTAAGIVILLLLHLLDQFKKWWNGEE